MKKISTFPAAFVLCLALNASRAEDALPLFDAHIHYNEGVWQELTPQAALKILEEAKVMRALVSSTPNEGTRKLHELDPRRIVPELRPYRSGADRANWFNDPAVLKFVEEELKRGVYRGIGEFHLHGDEAQAPLIKRLVDLAVEKDLPLHAHSDDRAVEHLLSHHPKVKVLWAHAGMSATPETVGKLLDRHRNLWVELSIRGDIAPGGKLDPNWRELFLRHPARIMAGTDTSTPGRWTELPAIAQATRNWLRELPREVAERIAFRNAATLYGP